MREVFFLTLHVSFDLGMKQSVELMPPLLQFASSRAGSPAREASSRRP